MIKAKFRFKFLYSIKNSSRNNWLEKTYFSVIGLAYTVYVSIWEK